MKNIIVRTEINNKVEDYISSIKEKSKLKSSIITNPLETKVYSFKKNMKQYNIISLNLTLFPVYYFLIIFIILSIIYPKWFNIMLTVIFLIFSIPFSMFFWKTMFKYGIRKAGYKGNLTFLTTKEAWEVFIWDK